MSKSKDAGVKDGVLQYMLKQNRPYSAVDIHNNLHKEYGKTAVIRALEELSQEGSLKEKTYGKQKVYVAEQSQFPAVDESELKQMEAKLTNLQNKLKESTATVKKFEIDLRSIGSSMTTTAAKAELKTCLEEIDRMQLKLKSLKENNNAVSPQERQLILKNRECYVKEWRRRKRMANDILGAILEGYPKSKKDLMEEVGVETDEDFRVKPPAI